MKILQEITEELKLVLAGKTIDALMPPLIFVLASALISLNGAIITALASAALLGLWRLIRRQSGLYALGGLAGVAVAAGFAYLTRSAVAYFIPAMISSTILIGLTLVSIAVDKPLAAWASHLTRAWPLAWFWRPDVKPAYREVTYLWLFYFVTRLVIQVVLYQSGEAGRLAWANILLGWPVLIVILIITYLYGIRRLHSLGGPGVEEFRADQEPPWRGQTRGF